MPIVCLLDTGVDSTVFGNNLVIAESCHPTLDANDNYGHGTCVGSLIVWCEDLINDNAPLVPKTRIISFKVIEPGYRDNVNLSHVILDAVRRYYTRTRVYNMSLNFDENVPLTTRIRQCNEVDKIAQKYNVLIINSAGNIEPDQIDGSIASGVNYPDYLERFPIKQPADGKNVISVGSFSHKENNYSIAPSNSISPFSRVKSIPYISNRRIKPDVHAIGGNYENRNGSTQINPVLSVPIIGVGGILSWGCGTSLSSPQIASLLARLTEIYKGEIINAETYRALLYSSSEPFEKFDRFYFGPPRIDKLFFSTENSFLVWSEGTLRLPTRRGLQEEIPQESFNFAVPLDTKRISIFIVHSDNYSDGQYTMQHTNLKVFVNKPGPRHPVSPHKGNLNDWTNVKFGIYKYQRNYMGVWKITVEPEYINVLPRFKDKIEIRYGVVVRVERDSKVPGYLRETLEGIYDEIREHNLEPLIKPMEPTEEVAIALA